MKFRKKSLTALLMAACMIMTTPVMPVAAEETNDPAGNEAVEAQEDGAITEEENGTENSETGENAGTEENTGSGEEGGSGEGTETGEGTGNQGENGEESGDVTEPGDDETVDTGAPEGDGNQESPYQIGTAEELFWFADLVNGTLQDGTAQNTYACAELTADIVFDQDDYVQHSTEWIPIGWDSSGYSGRFDGDGHSVSGVMISGNSDSNYGHAGFFGHIAPEGVVQNLTITDSEIKSEGRYLAGGIAVYLEGTITNCRNEADVEGGYGAGGIAAECWKGGVIENCTNEGVIRGEGAGGIAALNDSGQIRNCINTGKIMGSVAAAGIVASLQGGYIVQSVNYGTVQAVFYGNNKEKIYCGGIAGNNNLGYIIGCGNSGDVNSVGSEIGYGYFGQGAGLGGIVGISDNGTLVADYNTGKIGREGTNANYAGGIAGYSYDYRVWNCYNAGEIIELTGFSRTSGATLGVHAYTENSPNILNCYYLSGSAEKAYGIERRYAPPARMAGNATDIDIPEINDAPAEIEKEEFESGEMAVRLNQFLNFVIDADMLEVETGTIERNLWRQNIEGADRDLYPVTDPTHKIVYANYTKKCPDAPKVVSSYNNEKETVTIINNEHDYHEGAPCSGCGAFAPEYTLEKNTEGFYEINTADELYWFAAKVNGLHGMEAEPDADAVLTADIVVNEKVLDNSGQLAESPQGYREWTPIGYDHTDHMSNDEPQEGQYLLYQGTFDGGGHTISGLYYEGGTNESVGLFGLIGENAVIKNVHVKDTYFAPASNNMSISGGYGGIVGIYADTYSYDWDAEFPGDESPQNINLTELAGISGCSFEGSVAANEAAGGIVGAVRRCTYVPYIIYNCENRGEITAYNAGVPETQSGLCAGGICGELLDGNLGILRCGNAGGISGYGFIGGILGGESPSGGVVIFSSYNTEDITAVECAGGIIGNGYSSTVLASYSYGTVSTASGLYEGAISGESGASARLQNCYYNTDVYEGGIAGGPDAESSNNIIDSCGYTEAEFASGMVGDKLNADIEYLNALMENMSFGVTEDWWYQTLNVDEYPVLDATHGAIIADGTEENPEYSNPEELTFTVALTSRISGGTDETVANLEGGGTYKAGAQATVKAPEVSGFTFRGWFLEDDNTAGYTGEAISLNLEYTFKVIENTALVAVYEPNGNAVLRVEGTGFTVNGGVPQYGSGYNKSLTLGSTVTLEYVGSNDFLYWKDEGGKILSKDKNYSFTLLGNTAVIPVYIDSAIGNSGYALVEFVSDYGQVLMAETYGADSEIEFPAGPSKMGEVFRGWSMDQSTIATVESVKQKISEKCTHITLTPLYESSGKTYTITVIADHNSAEPILYKDIEEGIVYTVTAPTIAGRKFAYWSSDSAGENKLSFSQYYGVKVSGNVTLYAIYQDKDAEIEKLPTVSITEAVSFIENNVRQLRFISSYDVPEGYELQETGVIYSTNSVYGEKGAEETFIIDGENVNQVPSSAMESYGTYTLGLTVGDKVDLVAYVRGYLTVKNESTGAVETIYSDISSGSFNSLQ